jgi:NADH-quinone oxidoreductase subunit K
MGIPVLANIGELLVFGLPGCVALACVLFSIGAWGVLARRNVLVMLISLELMLSSVMLVFIAFARAHVNLPGGQAQAGEAGQLFALFIIAVAASEVAVGLAIVIAYFRLKSSVDSRDLAELKG